MVGVGGHLAIDRMRPSALRAVLEQFGVAMHHVHHRGDAAQRGNLAGEQIDHAEPRAAGLVGPGEHAAAHRADRADEGAAVGDSREGELHHAQPSSRTCTSSRCVITSCSKQNARARMMLTIIMIRLTEKISRRSAT